MKLLRALEARLVRVEAAVAVALVLAMLALAGYNVIYRNVLVPLQKHWANSGPVVATVVAAPPPAPVDGKQRAAEPPTAAEGFAGDWGEGGDDDVPPEETPSPAGAAEGFGGDWGEDDGAPAADVEAKDPDGEDGEADDGFGKLARIDAAPTTTPDGAPLGGPPPEGSFAAGMVALIDRIKMGWIDVVLRQMVILVSFFGAMMATQRAKHINVDALSKLIGPRGQRWLAVATNLLATSVCAVFASAGADLVGISRQYPHALVPWADEWVFQLMFPVGFGLLAFHFGVRVIEAAAGETPGAEATNQGRGEGAGAA